MPCSHPFTIASAARSLNVHLALPLFSAAEFFPYFPSPLPSLAIGQQAILSGPSPPAGAAVSTIILRV
jgi:hypothetical protein